MTNGGLVTMGEALVALRATDVGTTRMGDRFALDIAGAESNVAVGVARLGGRARFIGRVGDDDAGRAIERALRGEGVDLAIIVDADRPTGMLLATSPAPARSRVTYGRAMSAGSRLSPDDFDVETIASAELLHVTGITPALSATCTAAVAAAITIARRNAVTVSFDVNYRSKLWSREQAAVSLLPFIEQCDLLFAGIDEALLLLGRDSLGKPSDRAHDPIALADALHDLGPRTVVITDGADGSWLRSPDGAHYRQPALPTTVIDSTGAGDAFAAGFLAETLRDAPVPVRLRVAAACGARACVGRGDWRNAPTRRELESLLGTDSTSSASNTEPIER